MKPIGKPYSILLSHEVARITNKQKLANSIRVQPQGGAVSYRLDGDGDAVDGFILPTNEVLLVNLSETTTAFSVWSTELGTQVRLVIQECNQRV